MEVWLSGDDAIRTERERERVHEKIRSRAVKIVSFSIIHYICFSLLSFDAIEMLISVIEPGLLVCPEYIANIIKLLKGTM